MSEAEELVIQLQTVTQRLKVMDGLRDRLAGGFGRDKPSSSWRAMFRCEPKLWFHSPHDWPREVELDEAVLEEFYAFVVHRVQQLEADVEEIRGRLSRMEERTDRP